MNRRIAAWPIAVVTMLGLAACSGSPSAAPATSAPVTTAPSTPVAGTSAGQSVSEACISMAGPLAEASTAMAKIASVDKADAQSAVKTWTTLVDAFRKVADSVSNQEVKAAATTLHKDLAAVRDALKKIYLDGDMTAMSDLTTASTDMQTSYTALNKLCVA